jgi:DNA-binding NarL/FixJ family response regulator
VDDHEIFRHGLRDLIDSLEGFQVVAEADSCKDTLICVRQMQIDLVILDLYLPDGDGIQVTRQLKQQVTNPPSIIILSAIIYDDTLVDAILAGADGYLTKDMPAVEIVKSLKAFQGGLLALPQAMTTNLVYLLVQKFAEKGTELFSNMQIGNSSTDTTSLPTEKITNSASFPMLTQQEARVFELLRQGQSNKQIASQLSISPYTVGKHVQKILRKLGVTNRTQAAAYTSFEGGINI